MREYLLSQKEIKQYDYNAINEIGMPVMVLMERAAIAVLDYILEQFPTNNIEVLVAAGNGNNGGDGVAIARLLTEYGYNVQVLIPCDEEKYTEMIRRQVDIAKKYGVSIMRSLPDKEYHLIIDALFGVGLNRDITGEIASLIDTLNKKNAYKLSVDIPSGIETDTGRILGTAFVADSTVTFGFYKRGQLLREGPRHCGSLIKKNIGINSCCFLDQKPEMFMYIYDDEHNNKIDIGRSPLGNKGTFGKVLIIAGREDMSGACVLAAKAALRSGCGMVSVLTEEANRAILIAALPECIVHTYKEIEDIEEAFKAGESWADVIAVGPGIGTDAIGMKLLKLSIFESNKPLVVDADAINILARNKRLKIMLLDRLGNEETKRTLIFTPHVKEFARLSEKNMADIQADKVAACQFFSRQFHCILALKDAYTIVCENDNTYINIICNDAMATAGSGDVLTGLTASILSQYVKKKDTLHENPLALKKDYPFYAAAMSVFVHSRAGIKATEMNGRSYMIASDVIEKFSEVLI